MNPGLINIPPASPEFKEEIRQEKIRIDYKNKLRDVLDNFGKIIPNSNKLITDFELKQRETLLNKVEEFWIEGFLKPSLYFNTAVDINIDRPSGQILRPIDDLEVLPFDIDESYNVLQKTDITEQISDGKTLLILGEPGSGKTIALLQLAAKLIEHTRQNTKRQIPVVFNLSSWEETRLSIEEWLIEELKDKYQVPKAWSVPWIKEQQLTLLLDGLDEVKENHRNACVRAINKFIADDHLETEIVVCSRVKDYETLVERLLLSSAICIQPLSEQQLLDFLENADDSLLGLKTVIEQDQEIAEFAQSPLILNMMTWTYQNWSEKECQMQFRIAKDREFNLFESYIEKSLQREDVLKKYPKEKILYWLSWLGKVMIKESKIIFLIEKLQPTLLTNKHEKLFFVAKNFLMGGLPLGLIGGLTLGVIEGLKLGLTSELELIEGLISFGFSGLVIGGLLSSQAKKIRLFDKVTWSLEKVGKRTRNDSFSAHIGAYLVFGYFLAIIFMSHELILDTHIVLVIPLLSVIWGLSLYGSTALSFLIEFLNEGFIITEVQQRISANQGIKNSWNTSLIIGKFNFLFCLLISTFISIIFMSPKILLFGLGLGIISGYISGLKNGGGTCIQHFNLRQILHRQGHIPWNYASFLYYAFELRLMKKVGGGYIFYHRMLMEHFANMELEQ